jgi:AcrR family transcriptional regulator
VGTVVAERPARKHGNRGKLDPDISLERIVDSAIDLADTEGLTGVSMRRIAIELRVAIMRCTATCVARTLCAC